MDGAGLKSCIGEVELEDRIGDSRLKFAGGR